MHARRIKALLLAVVAIATAGSAAAAECLTMPEQRAAIRSGEAVRPAAVRRTVDGEVLRLSLCPTVSGLVYRVVVLKGDGRVSTHEVNAATGALVR